MWHSNLNDMEIIGTKRCIPKAEFGLSIDLCHISGRDGTVNLGNFVFFEKTFLRDQGFLGRVFNQVPYRVSGYSRP